MKGRLELARWAGHKRRETWQIDIIDTIIRVKPTTTRVNGDIRPSVPSIMLTVGAVIHPKFNVLMNQSPSNSSRVETLRFST